MSLLASPGNIHLFFGPSLLESEIPRFEGSVLHGPASQGDVYKIVPSRPFAIGIIDGYFEHRPAVWHKEILWALSNGIHVFGAGSMGALRAVELAPFGMVGVGKVFECFRDGIFEDDDEVAVVHGPAETRYRAGSEAMVNVRATLETARHRRVISEADEAIIVSKMKERFYPDRLWDERALEALDSKTAAAFRQWISKAENRVDQKRSDALLMVTALLALRAERPGPKQVGWRFARTDAWELVRSQLLASPTSDDSSSQGRDAVLNEVRLSPNAYEQLVLRTNIRLSRSLFARAEGLAPDETRLRATMYDFMTKQGLSSERDVRSWQDTQGLNDAELARILNEQAEADSTLDLLPNEVESAIVNTLKLEGNYAQWASRALARNKQGEKKE